MGDGVLGFGMASGLATRSTWGWNPTLEPPHLTSSTGKARLAGGGRAPSESASGAGPRRVALWCMASFAPSPGRHTDPETLHGLTQDTARRLRRVARGKGAGLVSSCPPRPGTGAHAGWPARRSGAAGQLQVPDRRRDRNATRRAAADAGARHRSGHAGASVHFVRALPGAWRGCAASDHRHAPSGAGARDAVAGALVRLHPNRSP